MPRVLLIDEKSPASRILEWILVEAGYDVRAVTFPLVGEAARFSPDVVVFDTAMPPGLKAIAIEALREAAPGVRIIDLSADSLRAAGADGHLRIPFHADDLLREVEG